MAGLISTDTERHMGQILFQIQVYVGAIVTYIYVNAFASVKQMPTQSVREFVTKVQIASKIPFACVQNHYPVSTHGRAADV